MAEIVKVVTISPDGIRTTSDCKRDVLGKFMRDAVNGYFERISLPRHGFEMYVNEDGFHLGLEPNALATTLYMEEYGVVPPVLGTALIIGINEASLTPDLINKVHEHATKIEFIIAGEIVQGDLDNIPNIIVTESALEAFLRLEREDSMTPLTDDPIPGEESDDE